MADFITITTLFFGIALLFLSLTLWSYLKDGRYSTRCKAWSRVGVIFLLVASWLYWRQ